MENKLLENVSKKVEGPKEHTGQRLYIQYTVIIIIISAPNENSQKASKSVNVLAAGSQDEICVNEHQN